MELDAFSTVLGHPRVLAPGADADRRVLAFDGETIIGIAAYDPLFGHQAEAAIAVVPGSAGGLVSFLLDGLAELAGSHGISVLRFMFADSRQRGRAAELIDGRGASAVRSDRLEIRTSLSTHFAPIRKTA